jgi:hypothetical protein
MCKLLSAVVVRPFDGEPLKVIIHEYSDSHELIAASIKDHDSIERVAKVEFIPKDNEYEKLDNYELKLDEPHKPSWWTDELAVEVVAFMRKFVQARLITGEYVSLNPGRYFVHGECKVIFAEFCHFEVGAGAKLTIADIKQQVSFGYVYGTVTTGNVYGTVTTGYVSGPGSVKTKK